MANLLILHQLGSTINQELKHDSYGVSPSGFEDLVQLDIVNELFLTDTIRVE